MKAIFYPHVLVPLDINQGLTSLIDTILFFHSLHQQALLQVHKYAYERQI